MRRAQLSALLVTICLCSFTFASTAPHIFYTDLQSGPSTGGQNNRGVFVTLYGTNFGASQGTSSVTFGGHGAASYISWSNQKIVVQPGSSSITGNIVVHVGSAGSNGIKFTVRSAHIYFVSTGGSDSAAGFYSSRWRTVTRAAQSVVPGDTVYVMNGVQQTVADGNGAALSVQNKQATSALPIAMLAYPGAVVKIGSSGTNYGIYVSNAPNMIFAGLAIQGASEAIRMSKASGTQIISDNISCPTTTVAGACLDSGNSTSVKVYGNTIHDSGAPGTAQAQFDAVHFTSGSGAQIGWNEIARTNGCRAVHFSTLSGNQWNIAVHDNWIHDSVCDGISLANVDPSKGSVSVYNNVIARAGQGPYPGAGSSFACIAVAGSGLGTVQINDNTLNDCGAQGGSGAGAISATTPSALNNTIVNLTSAEDYLAIATPMSSWSGSHNLFNGAGTAPGQFSSTVDADPQFVDPLHDNYQLQSTSPAIDQGMNSNVARDFTGVTRPQGAAYDIGGFEFAGIGQIRRRGILQATPTSVSFGTVSVGSTTSHTVTLINAGTGNVHISQAAATGTGFSSSGLSGTTLSPGASVSVTMTFAPSSAASFSGNLAVTSDASDSTLNVPLSGSASQPQGNLSANPGNIGFGAVNTGSTSTQTLTLTNTGSASLTINQVTASGTGFSVSGLTTPKTLAAGASATVSVAFAPTSVNSFSGSVTVASNASNPSLSVPLSGSGTQAPQGQLSASPSSINFGSITAGTSASQTVTLTNTGTASATVNSISISGGGYTAGGLTMPVALAAGAKATFQIKFAPSAAGTYNATAVVSSTAANSPTSIALTGTATTSAPSHSVALSWTDSDTSITGYNVYRGTQSGGPYSKVNTTAIAAKAWTDTSVQAGTTYYYTVTSINSSGQESAKSGEVQAVVPTP